MRTIMMLIAVVCYFAFFGSFVYLVGWIGSFDQLPFAIGGFDGFPTTVDKGREASMGTAVLIDIALIVLFGLQHSVMARPGFKRGWTKIVPQPLERSFYLLATVLALAALYYFWHPIEGSLWSVQNETARMAIWVLFFIGWGILFTATWLLNHFELFGLQQAWHHMLGKQAQPMSMKTPLLYRLVRHPIYTGFFIAFWATPDMTYSHLLAAVGFTIYIVIGIAYEERDLLAVFGQEYAEYQKRVGAFIPGLGKKG